MTAQKITLTICADQRTGHADTYIGIGAVEHITVTGIEVPDGTAIALVALDGAIMGLGHTVSNAAEVITATETAFKRFEFLDADRAEPAVIAVGDTNNLIATVQVLCRRNYLNGATPPAIDIPIYPTGPELEAILAQMRKEAEAAKKSADAAKQSEDGALSARSDALLAANAAGQSAQNAASSAANAALYRNQAQIYARNAKKSEDAAKDAAFWADLSKQDAEARASEAADSAAAAYRSEKAAKTAETNAASSATAASGSVTAAAAEASKAETAAADAANAAQEASTGAATATEAADAAGAFAEEARAEANRAEQAAAGVPALLDGKSDYLDVDATLSAERGPERFVIGGRAQYDPFNPAKTTFTGWMLQGTRTNVGDGKSGTIDHVFWGAGKDKDGKALFRRGAFSDEVTAGLAGKQDTLTAGDGITLEGNVISADAVPSYIRKVDILSWIEKATGGKRETGWGGWCINLIYRTTVGNFIIIFRNYISNPIIYVFDKDGSELASAEIRFPNYGLHIFRNMCFTDGPGKYVISVQSPTNAYFEIIESEDGKSATIGEMKYFDQGSFGVAVDADFGESAQVGSFAICGRAIVDISQRKVTQIIGMANGRIQIGSHADTVYAENKALDGTLMRYEVNDGILSAFENGTVENRALLLTDERTVGRKMRAWVITPNTGYTCPSNYVLCAYYRPDTGNDGTYGRSYPIEGRYIYNTGKGVFLALANDTIHIVRGLPSQSGYAYTRTLKLSASDFGFEGLKFDVLGIDSTYIWFSLWFSAWAGRGVTGLVYGVNFKEFAQ